MKDWSDIPGWFKWRSAQEEAVGHFAPGGRFVEVGNYLGRSLCSLADVVRRSGKRFTIIGVDTCRGSGPEGPRKKDYHGEAVKKGGGTFAGMLHRNVIECGFDDLIALLVTDSVTASTFFPDRSIDWVHLDARHEREALREDIAAWLPKVRIGGWLSGDDYDPVKWPEVFSTINEVFAEAQPWSVDQWRWHVQ